jgi:DNA mismatch repair ATPase MutS
VREAAHRSYGLNVARLADLPAEVLSLAKEKSRELEATIHARNSAAQGDKRPLGQVTSEVSLFKDVIRISEQGKQAGLEKQVLKELRKLLLGKFNE